MNDNLEDPVENNNFFYRSTVQMAKTWASYGNKVETHYHSGHHCEIHSFDEIVTCLDDGMNTLISRSSSPVEKNEEDTIYVDATQVASSVSIRFVSFTYDDSRFKLSNTKKAFPFLDERTQNLARALGSNVYLRVGGTHEDFLRYFDPDIDPKDNLTIQELDDICSFANATGWKIVFGLNANIGYNDTADHAWDPSDAKKLIERVIHTQCPIVGWELGNELNLGGSPSPTQSGKGKFTPALQADHFRNLAGILKSMYGDIGQGTSSSPFLAGPDVTHGGIGNAGSAPNYLRHFLGNFSANDHGVDFATYHHYFSKSVSVQDLTSASLLDSLKEVLQSASEDFAAYGDSRPNARLWLGETGLSLNNPSNKASPIGPFGVICGEHPIGAQCYYGGVVAYLDKLGLASRIGHSLVARQSLTNILPVGLKDGFRAEAVPEYFAALLHKRMMGTRILSIKGDMENGRTLRTYAACSPENDGTISMFAINLRSASADLKINVDGWDVAEATDMEVFFFNSSPEQSSWNAFDASLNGVKLAPYANGTIPAFVPNVVSPSSVVTMPPQSVVFVKLNGSAKVCL